MKKRIASLFLTVLLVCGMVLSMTVTASAFSFGEHYIEFAPGGVTKSFDLTYDGVTYYHISFTIYKEVKSNMNFNWVIGVKCLKNQDFDAKWVMYFENDDGSFYKRFFVWDQNWF